MGTTTTLPRRAGAPRGMPLPLENGDRLTRAEFERRYEAMPNGVKAELIEGVVHIAAPVRIDVHGEQTAYLVSWLTLYSIHTAGTQVGDNSTARLDTDNEPQPDALLRIRPGFGGQSGSTGGYVEGAPGMVAEVAASSASIDLHAKLNAYRRNEVREYLVWRVLDEEVDWFVWREGQYERLAPDAGGVYRSEVFPGLWLDVPALLHGDMAQVLRVLQQGIGSREHAAFTAAPGA